MGKIEGIIRLHSSNVDEILKQRNYLQPGSSNNDLETKTKTHVHL